MNVANALVLSIVLLAACGRALPQDVDRAPLLDWLREHGREPVEYVLGKFAAHDVVLLGEHHEVRENCAFVARLVPGLAAAGVHCLVTEFLCTRQQADVDRLVSGTGEAFDEALGIELFRDLPWPSWGYREYLDILQAVWTANHARASDAQPLRVIGLDSDWRQVELWRMSDKAGFPVRLRREQHMVEVAEREVLEQERKALFHIGWAHSLTWQGVRLGTVLRQRHGERLFQVALHHAHSAAPLLEELFAARGGAVGFDVVGSPLAKLRIDPPAPGAPKLTVDRIGEGLVFLVPVSDLHKVRWIDGFIDDRHFEDARFVAVKRGWISKESDVADAAALHRRLAEVFR